MIPALIACFFGAALAAACDPDALQKPPFEVVPTLSSADDFSNPRPCGEARSEDACAATLTCVWSGSRCQERDFTLP
jgi:hypothetical protein